MSRFATVVAFFGAPGAALQLRSSSADKHDHIISTNLVLRYSKRYRNGKLGGTSTTYALTHL